MRMRYWHLSLLVGAALLAPACTNLTGPNHTLSDDEAAFLAEQMTSTSLDGVSQSMAGMPGMAGAPTATEAAGPTTPITWERTFTKTGPCPAGGTVTMSGSSKGTIDSQTHSGTVEVNHTLSMDDCAFTRDAVTITVNTDPDITMNGTVTIEAGHRASGSFTKRGTFLWVTSDGRSGSCTVDLTVTWGADGSHTINGTVCDRPFAGLRHRGP